MGTRSEWLFTKTEAAATKGMVTADPLPAEAGVEMLRQGGNALDAALATAFALGVTSPIGSGLGGIAGLVIWRDGKTSAFDGSTRAPIASGEHSPKPDRQANEEPAFAIQAERALFLCPKFGSAHSPAPDGPH